MPKQKKVCFPLLFDPSPDPPLPHHPLLVYGNDQFIPKNTSVLVARIPLEQRPRRNYNDRPDPNLMANVSICAFILYSVTDTRHFSLQESMSYQNPSFDHISQSSDFSRFETEEEAIRAAVTQSTVSTDPSRFVRVRGQAGPLHPGYRCFRCGQSGHHIKNCPTNSSVSHWIAVIDKD